MKLKTLYETLANDPDHQFEVTLLSYETDDQKKQVRRKGTISSINIKFMEVNLILTESIKEYRKIQRYDELLGDYIEKILYDEYNVTLTLEK